MVVFCPPCIILVQFWLDPVIVRNHVLHTVIANHNSMNRCKRLQRIIISLDQLHLFSRGHSLGVDVL